MTYTVIVFKISALLIPAIMKLEDYFILDQKNNPERIWIECKVIESKELTSLQENLQSTVTTFRAYPSETFHLTLYHFGKPDVKHKAMWKSGIFVDYEQYLRRFINLLQELKDAVPKTFSLEIENLSIFGSANHRVLGLKLKNTREIQDTVEYIYNRTNDFYKSFGIDDPESFFAGTTKLIHTHPPHHFKPHVSLGIIGLRSHAKVPKTVSIPRKLEFLPSRIVHFKE